MAPVDDLQLRFAAHARALQREGGLEPADDPGFLATNLQTKQAFVAAFALLAQNQGVATLARFLKEGDGILAKKEQEDLAVAARQAVGFLRTPGAIAALEKYSGCLNKRVREAAREALRRAGVER